MATEGLPNLLGQSFPAKKGRSAASEFGGPSVNPADGGRQPYWGAPRLHGELLKLGIAISERTVSRFMPKNRNPPSQTWRTFLNNHVQDLVSVDFFTVPTVSFRVVFVFIVLAHHRRRIVHFNVTEHPTAGWATDGGVS